MISHARLSLALKKINLIAFCALALLLTGCASTAPNYQATNDNTRTLQLVSGGNVGVGNFTAASDDLNHLTIRAERFSSPYNDSFAEYLKQALRSELEASGKLNANSATTITGILLKNELNTPFDIGTAHISARIVVTRNSTSLFDKVISGDSQWESSFIGAIAIPASRQHYADAIKKLLRNLFADPDFRKAAFGQQTGQSVYIQNDDAGTATSASPSQSNAIAPSANALNQIPINSGAIKYGQSSVTVEKLAKVSGCQILSGAELIATNGPTIEDYRVSCADGRQLFAFCEYRQCSLKSSEVGSAAVASSSPAQTSTGHQMVSASTPPSVGNATQGSNAQAVIEARPYGYQYRGTPVNSVKAVVAVGVASGGEALATVTYTDNSTTNTKAGSGAQLSAGVEYRFDEHFSVQSTLGYQQETTNATNGNVRFSRFPFELLGYYNLNDSWRVGGGLRVDLNPKLTSAGAASQIGSVDFNNATGGVLELEYLIGRNYGFKLRGIQESFTQSGYSTKFSGNQIALFFNVYY